MDRKDDTFGVLYAITTLMKSCHQNIEAIMCRFLLPECAPEGIVFPCRSLCEEILAVQSCLEVLTPYFRLFNMDIDLKLFVNHICLLFPSSTADEKCFSINVTCKDPEPIENGVVTSPAVINEGHEHSLNSSSVYMCDEDYELIGHSAVYCQYSGLWSTPPRCVLKKSRKNEVIMGSVFGFLGLILIIICILCIRYRKYIMVLIYVKYAVRLKTERKDSGREVDAFIAYSEKDLLFVQQNLIKPLERKGFTTLVHHRDWPIGTWIANNIINSVGLCKRAIIVLSQNFIDSKWCRYEFEQAHKCHVEDRAFQIIVIALQDPKEWTNVPQLFQSYIKTGTYFRRCDAAFWSKLCSMMPTLNDKADFEEETEIEEETIRFEEETPEFKDETLHCVETIDFEEETFV